MYLLLRDILSDRDTEQARQSCEQTCGDLHSLVSIESLEMDRVVVGPIPEASDHGALHILAA